MNGRQVDQGNLEGKREKTSEKEKKDGDYAKIGGATDRIWRVRCSH